MIIKTIKFEDVKEEQHFFYEGEWWQKYGNFARKVSYSLFLSEENVQITQLFED